MGIVDLPADTAEADTPRRLDLRLRCSVLSCVALHRAELQRARLSAQPQVKGDESLGDSDLRLGS